MTDNFERAKDEILTESKKNGGVTTDHLLKALIATNADLDSYHELASDRHKALVKKFDAHIVESTVRDQRLDAIEATCKTRTKLCGEDMKAVFENGYRKHHEEYLASLGDSTFQSRLVWFFATAVGKSLLVVIGIIAGLLLESILR